MLPELAREFVDELRGIRTRMERKPARADDLAKAPPDGAKVSVVGGYRSRAAKQIGHRGSHASRKSKTRAIRPQPFRPPSIPRPRRTCARSGNVAQRLRVSWQFRVRASS